MTAFILDCSVAAAWCFEDEAQPETDALLDRLRTAGAVVPALWYWEVANVLAGAVRRRRLSSADAAARLNVLAALPVQADDEGVARAWRETALIAEAEGLTVYDAAYLELAIRTGGELATLDRDLRAAATRRGVRVIP